MKAKWVVIDIEAYQTTNPTIIERITEQAWNARPNHNTPKEEKLQWDTPESRDRRIASAITKTSLDPLFLEPLVICAKTDDMEMMIFDAMEESVRSAVGIFAEFVNCYCDKGTIFAGHNVEGYDLPLLLMQFQRLGIAPPEVFPTYRRGRWRGNIWDTMGACPGRTPFTSLVDAAMAYGLAAKEMHWKGEPMSGSRVGEAYEAGEYQMIRDYCAQDVRDEANLFLAQTCGGAWGIGSRTDATAEQLTEIAESTLTPAQKWLAATPILQSYGLLK